MRRRRSALSPLAAITVAVTGLIVIPATPASAAPLSLNNFQLRPATNAAELRATVGKLADELPNVGVTDVMRDPNRKGWATTDTPCDPKVVNDKDENGQQAPAAKVKYSICFQRDADGEDDNTTKDWVPQGVTTVADAKADQKWNDVNQPVLVSWYNKSSAPAGNGQKGVRVTFMNPSDGSYRHVLLVYPYINGQGNPSYTSLRTSQVAGKGTSLHAGGMVWYGNFLYVADTGRGFRVFDMRQILDLTAAGSEGNVTDQNKVGRHDGVYHAYGYRYVMPEVAAWTHTAPEGIDCSTGDAGPRFSFAGLDRSGTDHLTAGEYCTGTEYTGPIHAPTTGRVAAWPIAGSITGEEQRITGYWEADAAHNLPVTSQGAARFNKRWYLSQSRGVPEANENDLGWLHTTKEASASTPTLELASKVPAVIGPEDLSHWPGGSETDPTLDLMWTVAEHAGYRMVYASRP